MKTIIQQRYDSSKHLEYPEMEKLIDQLIENPNSEVTIPQKFLIKKHSSCTFLDVLIHKIKVFVMSIWLNIKKAFNADYRSRFKLAVKKIIQAYEEANKVSKIAEDIITPQRTPNDEVQTQSLEQKLAEHSIRQQIEEHKETNHDLETGLIDGIDSQEQQQEDVDHPNVHDDINNTPDTQNHILDTVETQDDNNNIDSDTAVISIIPNTTVTPTIVVDEKQDDNSTEIAIIGDKLVVLQEQPPVKTAYEKMYDSIKQKSGNNRLAALWKVLLSNVVDIESVVERWNCSGNRFTIVLSKPIHLWINNDRVGGCVFSLGNNNFNKITGTIENNIIHFNAGFTSYCKHYIFLGYKCVEPTMDYLHYKHRGAVEMSGTYWRMSSAHTATYDDMFDEWSNKVTIIPNDYNGGYQQFLEEKFQLQK